jgi:hypothetical protein
LLSKAVAVALLIGLVARVIRGLRGVGGFRGFVPSAL